ncbi:hypothetical protein D7Y13_11805 [Corallococcus praedator]|uniref:Uncharacterized protein n=1 Tax=Corallococcus praedator TaxID=2316724 RepID=A0ABX9QK46_9BACT|nr:hypothetical protein D7X75_07815 [Corallococcus sp. CA031C]RKI11006.1 hypothetical protein D7Y13_11805 [Corallococcus praedator]
MASSVVPPGPLMPETERLFEHSGDARRLPISPLSMDVVGAHGRRPHHLLSRDLEAPGRRWGDAVR